MLSLTENFTCSSNKIICFAIFIYDSNKELTLDIELSLPPENKVKPLFMSYSKCHSRSRHCLVGNLLRQPMASPFWICFSIVA